ncbi:MAG: hypothetical protein J6S02_06155 [Bacteroidaceae bacterium]|nr:hypothetical protein [Bacteroidaceae bacterium]
MLKTILNSAAFKPTSMFLAVTFFFMSVTIPMNAETVVVTAGTPVHLELTDNIDGNKVKQGQTIDFRVISDVIIDGKKVISAGSMAKGQVVDRKKSTLLGIPGEVQVAIKHVIATDGTMIHLSGSSLSDEGDSRLVVSLVVTFFCLFGFLIKGGKAQIPSGTTLQAYVASNTQLNVQ